MRSAPHHCSPPNPGINRLAPCKASRSGSKPLSFLGAAAFQAVNPKAWMMAVGYFSNYVPPHSSPALVMMSCLMFALINCPCICVWLLMGVKLEKYLQNEKFHRNFNWLIAGF